jgi:hypothetical protein
MDGLIDKMDGWVDGWMDGWFNRCMDGQNLLEVWEVISNI